MQQKNMRYVNATTTTKNQLEDMPAAKKSPTKKPAKKADAKETKPKVKRAPSAYIIFSTEIRETVKNENAGITFGEIAKKISEKWKKMSEKDKEPYNKASAKKKADLEKKK